MLKDLWEHITPNYAANWKEIGVLLDLIPGELRTIQSTNPVNLKWCCNQMLEMWLDVDPQATWKKVFDVLESPALSISDPSDEGPKRSFVDTYLGKHIHMATYNGLCMYTVVNHQH